MTAPGGLLSGEEPGCTQMGILVSGLPCADATWSVVLCFTLNPEPLVATWSVVLCFTLNLEDQRLIQNLRCDFLFIRTKPMF